MGAIVIGVVGVAVTAPPRSTTHTSQELTITLVLLGLALASLLPYVMRSLGRSPAAITMVGAGLAFGWSGVATKLASDDLSRGRLLPAAAWALSTAAASGVGVLSEMSALQATARHPGRAGRVRHPDGDTRRPRPAAARRELHRHAARRDPAGSIACPACRRGAAMARSPLLLALMEGQRISERAARPEPPHGDPGVDPLEPGHR